MILGIMPETGKFKIAEILDVYRIGKAQTIPGSNPQQSLLIDIEGSNKIMADTTGIFWIIQKWSKTIIFPVVKIQSTAPSSDP